MTPLHPRIHIPTWAAVAVVAAAYVVRSIMRGWDFRPDMPWDALVLVTLVAILAMRGLLKRHRWDEPSGGDDGGSGEPPDEGDRP